MKKSLSKKNKTSYFEYSAICFFVFIVFTLIVAFAWRKPIAFDGSDVGLAGLNKLFTPNYNGFFYTVSNILAWACTMICAFFALTGLIQWIKRKNFFKVDIIILTLGAFYIVCFMFYFFFDNVVVNMRPCIEAEPSYPSSHSVLAVCSVISGIRVVALRAKSKKTVKTVRIIGIILTVLMFITRYLSGMHWFTDIIGSALLSAALIWLFYGVTENMKPKKRKRPEVSNVG